MGSIRCRFPLVAAFLLVSAAACRPTPIDVSRLDSLESRLSISPVQRPAWERFRSEVERSEARWSSSDAPGRRELRAALAAEPFDRARAESAAEEAARAGQEDARRLIEAWSRVDAVLDPEQRSELRRAELF
jgi:hypothetical protein